MLNAFYTNLTFILNIKFYRHVNSPPWADGNEINSSARKYVFSLKWMKSTQDDLFSIFKSEHILRVYMFGSKSCQQI